MQSTAVHSGTVTPVVVAGDVDDLKLSLAVLVRAKDGIRLQELFQGGSLLHARQHPEGMAEVATERDCRERIGCSVRLLVEFADKGVDGILMYEAVLHALRHRGVIGLGVAGPHTEELLEGEFALALHLLTEQLREGEGHDLHLRQHGVGVGVAIVTVVPLVLRRLLHDIVPGVDLASVLVGLKLVEQVEGRAR